MLGRLYNIINRRLMLDKIYWIRLFKELRMWYRFARITKSQRTYLEENNMRVAGGRGYSAGKAYPSKTVGVLKMLGDEKGEETEEYELEPVKISKAFKRRKNGK